MLINDHRFLIWPSCLLHFAPVSHEIIRQLIEKFHSYYSFVFQFKPLAKINLPLVSENQGQSSSVQQFNIFFSAGKFDGVEFNEWRTAVQLFRLVTDVAAAECICVLLIQFALFFLSINLRVLVYIISLFCMAGCVHDFVLEALSTC